MRASDGLFTKWPTGCPRAGLAAGFMATVWLLLGCSESPSPVMVGQLESQRLQISGPVSETLRLVAVEEGARVEAGDLLFRLDDSLATAAANNAAAALAVADASLAQVLHGPRQELILAAQALHDQATEDLKLATLERQRAADLSARELGSQEALDRADAAQAMATARLSETAARVLELKTGSTPEEVAIATALLQQAAAELARLELMTQQLTVLSPVAGVVDQLLFEAGERPAAGQPVVTLLQTADTYARIYVPAAFRSQVQPGQPLDITLQGESFTRPGILRWVSSEAAFTPYFALTSQDRDRLTYAADVTLVENPGTLPSGLALQAQFVDR